MRVDQHGRPRGHLPKSLWFRCVIVSLPAWPVAIGLESRPAVLDYERFVWNQSGHWRLFKAEKRYGKRMAKPHRQIKSETAFQELQLHGARSRSSRSAEARPQQSRYCKSHVRILLIHVHRPSNESSTPKKATPIGRVYTASTTRKLKIYARLSCCYSEVLSTNYDQAEGPATANIMRFIACLLSRFSVPISRLDIHESTNECGHASWDVEEFQQAGLLFCNADWSIYNAYFHQHMKN